MDLGATAEAERLGTKLGLDHLVTEQVLGSPVAVCGIKHADSLQAEVPLFKQPPTGTGPHRQASRRPWVVLLIPPVPGRKEQVATKPAMATRQVAFLFGLFLGSQHTQLALLRTCLASTVA